MDITKENLIKEFGMKENIGRNKALFPLEKVISLPIEKGNEDMGEAEGDMSICLTTMREIPEMCLMLPDGACIYLCAKTIEDLKTFEDCIHSWEPC